MRECIALVMWAKTLSKLISLQHPLAPGMLGGESVEASLPLVSSGLGGTALTLHGFSALHRNAAWGWVREKVARARCICNHTHHPWHALLDSSSKS